MPNAGRDGDLIGRFRDGVHRVARTPYRPFDRDGRFGLAVSGGPDSLALLLLANTCFPGRVEAATFDHGFRPESADEARSVAAVCADLGVPHQILSNRHMLDDAEKANTERRERGGLQALARNWRYDALARWCRQRTLPWLFTAHHADDQAETVLMRLARGSGPRGLAGIGVALPIAHACGRSIAVADAMIGRPLLAFTKVELAAHVEGAGLRAFNDPSNLDPRFDRSRARMLLAAADWLQPRRLSAVADIMRDSEEGLSWAARDAFERVTRHDDGEGYWLDPHRLPAAILRRVCDEVIYRIVEAASGGAQEPRFRGAELTTFIERLQRGEAATICDVMAKPGAEWHFEPAPRRRDAIGPSFAISLRLSMPAVREDERADPPA